MQSNNTPQPYTVLELTPQTLFDIYGTYCHAFEQTVLTAMRRLLQDQYTGGAYELRKYLNGAVALVLPALDQVSASYGMAEETITLEGASIAANLIALGQLMVVADEREDESNKLIQYNQFYGLKDALKGQVNFIIDTTQPDGYRSLTEGEQATLKPAAQRHPDEEAIRNLID
ncbi:hypothetical protein [Pseudomonas veronii]|uniref:hypothetical protein n=1 Tax=Pseudomonas veronii TaxID=76761 RepID=UPI0018E71241|nr:hypothetical protein [Pseudomonas veronii]MBJ2181723.1 hypothetical protein [Pseudomonas veronii]